MRPTNLIGLLTAIGALIFAYFFLERYLRLLPCPLCILDRLVLVLMAMTFAAGLFAGARRPRAILLAANAVWLAFGLAFAGRHVWMQGQPLDPTRGCLSDTPAFAGVTEFLRAAFNAESDCGAILWQLFGLSIPALTLLLFVFLGLLLAAQGYGILLDAEEGQDGVAAAEPPATGR